MSKHYVEGECGVCGKPAKIFVGMIAGGKKISTGFCEEHAEAAGVLDAQGYALLESAAAPAAAPRAESSTRCPVCDCSQRDFDRHGRFGCTVCYTTFAGILPDMLKRMHPSTEHRGKLPRRASDPALARQRGGLGAAHDEAARAARYEKSPVLPAPLPSAAPRKAPRRAG